VIRQNSLSEPYTAVKICHIRGTSALPYRGIPTIICRQFKLSGGFDIGWSRVGVSGRKRGLFAHEKERLPFGSVAAGWIGVASSVGDGKGSHLGVGRTLVEGSGNMRTSSSSSCNSGRGQLCKACGCMRGGPFDSQTPHDDSSPSNTIVLVMSHWWGDWWRRIARHVTAWHLHSPLLGPVIPVRP